MQSQGNANHYVSIGLNFGILLVSIGPTWYVLSGLEKSHEIEIRKSVEEESSPDEEELGEGRDSGEKVEGGR